MAKIKVHELAKELNIKSKDIIEALKGSDYEVKSANSSLEDDGIVEVKKKFKANANKSHGEVKADERPKKKASISAVYNAQYSKEGRRQSGKDSRNGEPKRANKANRKKEQAKTEQHSIIKPRPVGERALRPISERTASNNGDEDLKKNVSKADNKDRQQQRTNRNDRNNSNVGRNDRRNDKNGDRNNDRRNSEKRNDRDFSKNGRSFEGRGDRNNNRGDRNNDRRNDRNNNRGDRNNDRRNDRNNDRNNDRRNDRRNDRDSSNNRNDRFGKSGFTKDVMPAVEEGGKETRNRNNKRNNNNTRRDHDKLGKKKENYVNLEKHGGKKKPQPQPKKEEEDVIKTIILPDNLTIRELADKMKVQPATIIKKLFLKGEMVTVNQDVDFEKAEEIALEFNCICEHEVKVDVIAELLKEAEEDPEKLVPRAPVVCVMGHVDHGKTSLLDAIRSTRVTDKEAGGITQHIGASVVPINGHDITFLDTPGHEAFTAMRMRGANSTDIAVLVVAADDGVMPQTVEAINHAKAAGVEIIVAVNKMDKPSANIEKVKQELAEYELIPEDWGGSTIFCPVSAKSGEGITNLLEMILLTAEVLELKANPDRNARGIVIEAQLDKGRGSVATVLVQKGTLHVGDPIACGCSYGKVRAMINDKGERVKVAGPSQPVEILGLNNVPEAGDIFVCMDNEKEAKSFADTFIAEGKNKLLEETKSKMSLDDLFSQIQSGNMKELAIVVKADVQGSVEAVKQSLVKLSNDEVVVKVIHGGVGAINESDVILASASNAIIIGFNVRPDPIAKATADREGVDVRLYKVIYSAIEDVEAAMKGMLDPVFEEKVIGHAEIRQIFKASGIGNIAGSYVLDGCFERGCKVRISREGEQIFEGDLASLKRYKDDVKEVKAGFECGLVFEGFNEIKELDIVEAYKMVEVPR
ncbi:translation initiation factor IF-2 [Lachnobacterium bovis]|uniref:translation initiation factor IF-2 n=1 Tax=Lachnobacterium bovis TaxID=140626 RepID=UPI000551EDB0|nr:translation initiation factor IF-2 [Lachnobacterium bovis]